MNTTKIKNLIFDLGGVIIDINPEAALRAFEKLSSVKNASFPKNFDHEIFLHYEMGKTDDASFRNALLQAYELGEEVKAHHLDEAWNIMLLDIPMERIKLLQKLRGKYQLFLLSNTNVIHIVKVNQILREQTGVDNLSDLFDKIYYSYEMNTRKPEAEIFKQVLDENNLKPEESLFIDDNLDNILGAQKLNIGTLHVTSKDTIFEYFRNEE